VGDLLVTEERLGAVATYLMKSMTSRAESSDDAWWAIDSVVEHAAHLASPEVIHAVVRRLIDESQLVELNRMLAVASEKTRLSKKQRAKMDNMLQLYADAKTPPTLKEVCEQLSLTKDAAQSLLRHATQQRLLTDLSNGLYIASEVFNTMVVDLATHFETDGQLTVPQIKDIWGVTRKHVIPLLEYCDQQQLTQRQGDVRVAGKRLDVFVQEAAGDHKP
jgi:selenocysteine-specific elongation factor